MTDLPRTWRLIRDGAADAATNMMRDRALFASIEHCEEGADPPAPALRLYFWKPWAVSLGRHQDPERALDRSALAERGYDWVRRPTGGRAVLHADEITYCIVAPLLGPFAGGLAASHRRIAAALARFYQGFDLSVGLTRPASPKDLDPRVVAPCFVAPGLAELELAGRKLAGSAQRRGRRALLQHGSLPLGPAHLELADLLPLAPIDRREMKRTLAAAAVSLGELQEGLPGRSDLESRLAAAFAAEFDIDWLEEGP